MIYVKSQEKLHDNIRQINTDASTPVKSVSRETHNTNLVFFIPTELEYTAMVYNVVSVDPIIVAAINPILESTPLTAIILDAIAVDALPEIGLNIANGTI